MATNGQPPDVNLRQLQDRLNALASLVYRLTIEVGAINGTALGAIDGTLSEDARATAYQEINAEVRELMAELEQAQK